MSDADATGRAEVVEHRDRPGVFTVSVDGTEQSCVDLSDPTHLEFDYVRRMADVLDLLAPAAEPLRCVHVGGAGLTLPRYVAATRPRSSQVVLEPDEAMTALVRERVPLPRRSGITVRPLDGRSGVAQLRDDHADVVVVDAFAGARVPATLATREWFADVARVTRPGGAVLLNLADKAPFTWLRSVLRGVDAAFAHVAVSAEPATLKGRRFGNVLVLASSTSLPVVELARTAARSPFPYRVLDEDETRRRLGGGRSFSDEDAQASPPPPGGAAYFS